MKGLNKGLKNPFWICQQCKCTPCIHDKLQLPLETIDIRGYIKLDKKEW